MADDHRGWQLAGGGADQSHSVQISGAVTSSTISTVQFWSTLNLVQSEKMHHWIGNFTRFSMFNLFTSYLLCKKSLLCLFLNFLLFK